MKKPLLIVITGPTASGKSALAVSLAKVLKTEIISADSRQIYKGIPIVTAVPTEEEMAGITHHLIEILPLDAYFSASLFEENSNKILNHIFQSHDTAILCGGSMLYIDALVNGIDELPTVPTEIRENLTFEWQKHNDVWLLEKLKVLDPVYYERVDKHNLKRVFHAVEISITAGRPYSELLTLDSKSHTLKELPYDIIKICLSGSRDKLFQRINVRVLQMIQRGLEEEAHRVFELRHLNSLNTVGLKEMFAMFEGKLSKEGAISRIQKNTRVYAKKQITWNKRDNNLKWLDFTESNDKNVRRILQLIN